MEGLLFVLLIFFLQQIVGRVGAENCPDECLSDFQLCKRNADEERFVRMWKVKKAREETVRGSEECECPELLFDCFTFPEENGGCGVEDDEFCDFPFVFGNCDGCLFTREGACNPDNSEEDCELCQELIDPDTCGEDKIGNDQDTQTILLCFAGECVSTTQIENELKEFLGDEQEINPNTIDVVGTCSAASDCADSKRQAVNGVEFEFLGDEIDAELIIYELETTDNSSFTFGRVTDAIEISHACSVSPLYLLSSLCSVVCHLFFL